MAVNKSAMQKPQWIRSRTFQSSGFNSKELKRIKKSAHVLRAVFTKNAKEKRSKLPPQSFDLFPTQRVNFYNVRYSFIRELWIHIRSSWRRSLQSHF
jgi:hypothetical protein